MKQAVLFYAAGPGDFTGLTGCEVPFSFGDVMVGLRKSRLDEQMIHTIGKRADSFKIFTGSGGVGNVSQALAR